MAERRFGGFETNRHNYCPGRPATEHPNEEWVVEQANMFVEKARGIGLRVAKLQHDRDTKFTTSFDQALKARRVKLLKNAYRAPNTNAFVERFIASVR